MPYSGPSPDWAKGQVRRGAPSGTRTPNPLIRSCERSVVSCRYASLGAVLMGEDVGGRRPPAPCAARLGYMIGYMNRRLRCRLSRRHRALLGPRLPKDPSTIILVRRDVLGSRPVGGAASRSWTPMHRHPSRCRRLSTPTPLHRRNSSLIVPLGRSDFLRCGM